ncbi:hypothetical protein [Saccharothrix xinjiangensis]|uniref:Uncharacterized protein n=1 Tax=Saccharothrix xinjiangensis TaxID=204798 RepID=A0ABV9Y7A1_9PSEU
MVELVSVRLAAEWTTDPLWVSKGDDPIPANYSAQRLRSDFGVPAELASAIDAWDAEFQSVYNRDDPAESGFTDESVADAWDERGQRLAEALAGALGVRVEFHTAAGDRVFGG